MTTGPVRWELLATARWVNVPGFGTSLLCSSFFSVSFPISFFLVSSFPLVFDLHVFYKSNTTPSVESSTVTRSNYPRKMERNMYRIT